MRCKLVKASTLDGYPQSVQDILEVITATEWLTDHDFEQDIGDLSAKRLTYEEPAYRQHFEGFEREITALDLLCNYGPEAGGVIREGILNIEQGI